MIALPELPVAISTLSNVDTLRLNRAIPNIPSPEHCVTCKGVGRFRFYDPSDRESVVDWECNCPEQWVLYRFLLNCGLGKAYQRLGWNDLNAEPGAVEVALRYLDKAEIYVDAGVNLIFQGSMGNGKTLLSTLVLRNLLARGFDGYFTTFSEMLSKLMKSWNDEEMSRWFYARIRNAGVLVIDDVGREMKLRRIVTGEGMRDFDTATSRFAFEDIVRYRIGMAAPTIITTNLSMDQLGQHYGPNLISLLNEKSTIYDLVGVDWRRKVAVRSDYESDNGISRPLVLA